MSGPIAPGLPGSPPSSPSHAGQAVSAAREKSGNLHKAVDPEIRAAAEGFEAMFLDYMMQVMRQTVPKNDMDLENGASEIYRGMLDNEYARKAVHSGGVGLADQIVAYLESQRYNLPRGSTDSGGSHAGQPDKQ